MLDCTNGCTWRSILQTKFHHIYHYQSTLYVVTLTDRLTSAFVGWETYRSKIPPSIGHVQGRYNPARLLSKKKTPSATARARNGPGVAGVRRRLRPSPVDSVMPDSSRAPIEQVDGGAPQLDTCSNELHRMDTLTPRLQDVRSSSATVVVAWISERKLCCNFSRNHAGHQFSTPSVPK